MQCSMLKANSRTKNGISILGRNDATLSHTMWDATAVLWSFASTRRPPSEVAYRRGSSFAVVLAATVRVKAVFHTCSSLRWVFVARPTEGRSSRWQKKCWSVSIVVVLWWLTHVSPTALTGTLTRTYRRRCPLVEWRCRCPKLS